MSQIHVTRIHSPQIIISGNNFKLTVDQATIRRLFDECDQEGLEIYSDCFKKLRAGQNTEFDLETSSFEDTKVFVMDNGIFTIRSLDCMFNTDITMDYQSNQRVIADLCDFFTPIIREQFISLKKEQNKKQKTINHTIVCCRDSGHTMQVKNCQGCGAPNAKCKLCEVCATKLGECSHCYQS